jgi:hypothetical protein
VIDLKELCKFLVKAKKATYASGDAAKNIIESDMSSTLTFEDGDWRYCDNYFGGEPFGGREVVFFKNQPVYMMVYYGGVAERVADIKEVYKFLRAALMLVPKGKPFRGPRKHMADDFEYLNTYEGEIDNFFGEETIKLADGKEIYRAKYSGGFVNQRK